jgi:hypothetical protein
LEHLAPERITAAASFRFWQPQIATLSAHIPLQTIPAHARRSGWSQLRHSHPIDRLRADQRIRQVHGAGIGIKLQLWPRAEHNLCMPISIEAAAHQQQSAGVQRDHSCSP